MNNRLLDLLIEFDEMGFAPTTVCEDAEEYAKKWKDRVWEEVKLLEAENAELRGRIDKAKEALSAIKEEISPSMRKTDFGFIVRVCTLYEHEELYGAEEAAEARLAELKGEKL